MEPIRIPRSLSFEEMFLTVAYELTREPTADPWAFIERPEGLEHRVDSVAKLVLGHKSHQFLRTYYGTNTEIRQIEQDLCIGRTQSICARWRSIKQHLSDPLCGTRYRAYLSGYYDEWPDQPDYLNVQGCSVIDLGFGERTLHQLWTYDLDTVGDLLEFAPGFETFNLTPSSIDRLNRTLVEHGLLEQSALKKQKTWSNPLAALTDEEKHAFAKMGITMYRDWLDWPPPIKTKTETVVSVKVDASVNVTAQISAEVVTTVSTSTETSVIPDVTPQVSAPPIPLPPPAPVTAPQATPPASAPQSPPRERMPHSTTTTHPSTNTPHPPIREHASQSATSPKTTPLPNHTQRINVSNMPQHIVQNEPTVRISVNGAEINIAPFHPSPASASTKSPSTPNTTSSTPPSASDPTPPATNSTSPQPTTSTPNSTWRKFIHKIKRWFIGS